MDLNMSVSAVATGILLFVLFLFLVSRMVRKNKLGLSRLPGPLPLPIIGNLHQLGALPHRGLQRLAEKHGPIMSVKFGSVNVVVASSSEAAKQFLKTHDLNFANRPSIGAAKHLFYNGRDIVSAPHGAHWREMRKICTLELLTTKKIESFGGVMEEEAVAMVKSIWEKSEEGRMGVNVSESVACYTSDLIWRMLTGRTNADRQSGGAAFEELIKETAELAGVVNIGDLVPWLEWLDLQGLRRRMRNVHDRFDAAMGKIIEEHADRKGRRTAEEEEGRHKDMVDVLLDTDITLDDKKAILMIMFLGGIDTATTTLEWAVSELLRNPSVMNKLQEEINSIVKQGEKITNYDILRMEYLHCVVKETLRLYPPTPLLFPYESTEACIVKGPNHEYLLPKKTRLIVNAWAIGRDPRVWKEPLEFRPERFVDKKFDMIKDPELGMIPFGAGRRGCVGASLGIVVVEFALAHLFQYFDWRSEDEIDMNESFGGTIPKSKCLFAIPTWK